MASLMKRAILVWPFDLRNPSSSTALALDWQWRAVLLMLVSGFGLQVLVSEHPEDPCLSSFFCCCFIDYLPKVLSVGVGDWYT